MSRTRRIMTLAGLAAAGSLLAVSPAFAGGLPGGPGNITPPAGFVRQYNSQHDLVVRTCWLTGPASDLAQRVFAQREAALDRRLAQAGLGASPTYFEFANLTYQGVDSGCPKG